MAGKYEGKRAKTRRPWEFKKKLAAWAVLIATATAVASYILAYLDKQTASDVTTTIFTACIGYLVSYAAASTTEKVSRNRHGLEDRKSTRLNSSHKTESRMPSSA